jgi:hypothetical protein
VSGYSGAVQTGTFTQGFSLYNSGSGILDNRAYPIYHSPFACTVAGLAGVSVSGSKMQVNAYYQSGSGDTIPKLFLANNLIITGTTDWHDATASLQNTAVVADSEVWVVISGSGTEIVGSEYTAVQLTFTKP